MGQASNVSQGVQATQSGKGQSGGGQAPVTGFSGAVGTMMNGANNFASNYTPQQSLPQGIDPNAVAANPQGYQQSLQQASIQEQKYPGSTSMGSSQGKGGQGAQLMSVQPPGQAQNTVTSGQPIMGQPNQYMNTIGQNNQPFSYAQPQSGGKSGASSGIGSPHSGGKGKG